MFRGEGLTERVGFADEVPLDNFGSLLADPRERGQHVIVESEDRQTADHDNFHFGRIIDRDDWSVTILNFSALGVWDDEPVVVGIDAITKIQFDTPYINTLTKYLNGPPLV